MIRAARVLGAHGVRGEVRVELLGGDQDRFPPGAQVDVEGRHTRLTVRRSRGLSGGDVLLSFDELADREGAVALRGTFLCVDEHHVRPLGHDEWFVFRLVGMTARSSHGAALGEVVDVESYPGHDVLVVRSGPATRRFPMSRAFVDRVDTDAGEIVLTPWKEEGDEVMSA